MLAKLLIYTTMNEAFTLAIAGSFILGLRHGIDWDHLAAITDIVGAKSSQDFGSKIFFGHEQKEAVKLSLFYAIGHAAIVILLGLAAINFALILPKWLDPIMERLVGLTLLFLGFWIIYSLWQYLQGQNNFRFVSRWMLIFAAIKSTSKWLTNKFAGGHEKPNMAVDKYEPRAALIVGMLHGIGAETGTQILLITAVGGSVQSIGLAMLFAFAGGLIFSNMLIGACGSLGFLSLKNYTRLYALSGACTAVFSLIIGAFFITGHIASLPDLQTIFTKAATN